MYVYKNINNYGRGHPFHFLRGKRVPNRKVILFFNSSFLCSLFSSICSLYLSKKN